ncbi:SOCS box domain-containing protein [Trichonephila clavata]|uniref:SOCS box domain-containing protein n=1 Tax=Trichonephila clavata TaxID=2740835 RepID=A0A8X6HFN1_TRICU|nr:SOCS box domain-containing protein [Trichonephila clavata]
MGTIFERIFSFCRYVGLIFFPETESHRNQTFRVNFSEFYYSGPPSWLMEEFENELCHTSELIIFNKKPSDLLEVGKLLLCKLTRNCSNPSEAFRIHERIFEIFQQSKDTSLLLDLLDSTCPDTLVRLHIFDRAAPENLNCLNYLLPIIKKKKFDLWGLWPNSSGHIATSSVINLYFYKKYFSAIPFLMRNGIHWTYSEDIFVDYCKRLNWNWIPSDSLFIESSGRSNHRFFLILLTYYALCNFYYDNNNKSLTALKMLWRSISDAFITSDEMINSLWKFSSNPSFMNGEPLMICNMVNLIDPTTVSRPRLLQHLCRCSIRQRLAENYQLPDGIQKVVLPTLLKNYVDLEYD